MQVDPILGVGLTRLMGQVRTQMERMRGDAIGLEGRVLAQSVFGAPTFRI